MPALHSPLLLQHKGPSLIPFVEHRWSQKASQRLSGRNLANSTRSEVRSGEAAVQRRHVLHHILLAATAGALSGVAQPAQADVIRDLLKGYIRPEVAADQAIMQLMDARGTLMELKALAATAANSRERFEARRVLPGMATRLRQVSSAAPVAAALASGTASESTLSYLYGGSAADGVSELSMAIPVYEAIGKVITISGRTIRKQAQASPEYAEAAIDCISRLLAACPQEDLDRAQEMRKARTNVKAV
ncbi:hypothetical protein ABBQ32_006794 [Trebouxia sp. C0010 RCD-2024]